MKQKNFKAVTILLICLLVQVGSTVSAQQTELKWLRGWKGGYGDNSGNQMNGLVVDDDGNTYVAGALNVNATFLDRTYASPVDDTMPACLTHGVIVAKYDTAGNLIWRKVCRSTLDGNSSMGVSGLAISGDRLYLLMSFYLKANYNNRYISCPLELWFFDTMYRWPFDYVNEPNINNMRIQWLIPDSLRRFPFNEWDGGRAAAFVMFDLDGNRLEHHSFVQRVPAQGYPEEYDNPWYHYGFGMPFVVDSKRNIYLFCDSGNGGDMGGINPTGHNYILDDDPTKVLTKDEIYGCTGDGYDTTSVPTVFHLIKIDSNWNFVEAKCLTQRLDTRQLVPYTNPSTHQRFWDVAGVTVSGLSIDEEDNIYLEGILRTVEFCWAYDSDTLEVDHPYRVFFDSTHYVKVENYENSKGIPIYAKYDSDGNLLWLNQMYLQTDDSFWAELVSHVIYNEHLSARMYFPQSMTWDSNYVYSKLTILEDWTPLMCLFPRYQSEINRPWNPHYWYLDSNYTMLVTLPDSHAVMELLREHVPVDGTHYTYYNYEIFIVLVYDRETGEPVRYINPFDDIPPIEVSERAWAKYGKIISTDDDLLIGCMRRDQLGSEKYYLLRYNKSSGVASVMDSNFRYTAHLLEELHPDGLLICRWPTTIYSNPPAVLPDGTTNAVYASCYYLPEFDQRRPVVVECAPVGEVRVTHVVEDDVTLTWHGGANHVAWQVAYLPTDAATDSAAWEHALLVETTDTTLTLPLDTCSLLRVRGICSAENNGPWSDAVEACPEPHIGIGNTAQQLSGPILSPNPATQAVTVVDGATGVIERQVIELEVISPLGQTVMHLTGVSRFNVADLSSGTYMVKIRTPRGTTLRKLTVR